MMRLHVSDRQVRGSRAGRRPRTALRQIRKPRLERLETRCLPGFLAPLAFDAGTQPWSVAVGDFNGDGKQDLAVANVQSNNVSVLLGKGDGTFLPAVNYAAGPYANSVAVGDFNGDGKLDLAVAGVSGVSVLLGNGDGTFMAAVNYSAGGTSVAVGDFNGDGKLDLAVAGGSGVRVLLGNGDGTFQAAVNYAAGPYASSVAVGDFNGDGIPDLAVANLGTYPLFNDSSVSILLGQGDGTFLPAQSYAAGNNAYSVAVGDFNGDGKQDLAVTNYGGTVSVLLGNGDGTFQTAVNYAAGGANYSVAVGDFNGDGKPDLAVANNTYPYYTYPNGKVSVLLGKGDGTFQPAVNFATGGQSASVAVGDFNGDGKPDLAVANYGGGVSVLLGKADGTFQTAPSFLAGSSPVSVAVGDFNGDGKQDLAVANAGTYPYTDGTVSVLLGKGDGTFLPALTFPVGSHPTSVAVGDFNGDGILDLAVANQGIFPYTDSSVSILLGKGDGTFLPAKSYAAGAGRRSVAVGDFNGDGKLDLVAAGYGLEYAGYYIPYDQDVRVLLGNGDGTFLPAQSFPAGGVPTSVAVGDFNGDGKQDLAVANAGTWPNFTDGSVSVLLGKGDGTFLPAQTFPAGNGAASVAVGDFNGDGKPDLAVANQGDVYGNGQGVSVLLGKGDGTFQTAVNYAAGGRPSCVAVGDFNGDGKQDLAVANVEGTVRVLLGKGDGTFQATNVGYIAGPYANSVAVGDFNGDGKQDLAVANGSGVSILLNDGNWPTGPSRARAGPSRPPAPEPLPPSAMHPFPSGEQPRLAASALLTMAPPPGNGPILAPPAPLALPGADLPPSTILAVLLSEGRPTALADPRAGPRAWRAAERILDYLFAELAANGIWDDRTDDGMPLRA
jgi:hypothetical protein